MHRTIGMIIPVGQIHTTLPGTFTFFFCSLVFA